MPQPAHVVDLQESLIAALRQAWDEILAEELAILEESSAFRRRARLEELRVSVIRSMDAIDVEVARWLNDEFTRVYGYGALAGEVTSDFTWAQPHMEALKRIANDTMTDVLKATRYVRRDVKRFIREVGRQRVAQMIAQGGTPGRTALTARQILQERGITAVVYRDGSRHGLAEYTQMLIRTKSAEAYNTGTLTQAASEGVVWWEIIDGPDCGLSSHDDPNTASGMIVDIGTSLTYPYAHPNCRRSFAPRPDIQTRKDARTARSFVTDAQRADIRAADRQRQRRALRSQVSATRIRGRSRHRAFRRTTA